MSARVGVCSCTLTVAAERQATAAAVALWLGAEAVVCFRAPVGGKLRKTRDMQVAVCLHVPVR
jgi:hypothetical protein